MAKQQKAPPIPESLIGELRAELEFPVRYILHKSVGEFKISIYPECWLAGGERGSASSIPFATWNPRQGLIQINYSTFFVLDYVGLLPHITQFCEQAYEAWKAGEEDGSD